MMTLQTPLVACDTVDPRRPAWWRRTSAVARPGRDGVLVVEPQCVVADDIAQAFEAAGDWVVGVASSAEAALALIADGRPLAGAVLDLDLRGGTAFPVADELARRDVPFLFLASHVAAAIPDRFAHVTCCEKPFDVDRLVPLLLAGGSHGA
jgi:CheY-like chemotaxis protein